MTNYCCLDLFGISTFGGDPDPEGAISRLLQIYWRTQLQQHQQRSSNPIGEVDLANALDNFLSSVSRRVPYESGRKNTLTGLQVGIGPD